MFVIRVDKVFIKMPQIINHPKNVKLSVIPLFMAKEKVGTY